MSVFEQFLTPSDAARRLGVSTKALRLYEQRGMIAPVRTAAGWRTYGPSEMARAAEIVALRSLGLNLGQVSRVLSGDLECIEPALAAHQTALEGQNRKLADTIEKVRVLRAALADGRMPASAKLASLVPPEDEVLAAFDLPWPWAGETFELRGIKAITFITGPLGSGKTRLARKIADSLPDAVFLDLDRLSDEGAATARKRLELDRNLETRVNRSLAWLVEEGAVASAPLTTVLVALESQETGALVIDMVEEGLDLSTQEALISYVRRGMPHGRALFLMTRSSAILDLEAVAADEAIILCPANHSPPTRVRPYPGTPGYEAVATCLAMPDVRARTVGTIACRLQAT